MGDSSLVVFLEMSVEGEKYFETIDKRSPVCDLLLFKVDPSPNL
jgi:hypothetical protein